MSTVSSTADPGDDQRPQLTFVLFGPGGVGKGTVAQRLIDEVENLWLSRSWTTRDQRPGEADDAYNFVSMEEFVAHREADGFLEWAESTPENLYGTPVPNPPAGNDVLLEIDAQGARQVMAHDPSAVLWFLDAPSDEALRERMTERGDRPDRIDQRIEQAVRERVLCTDLGGEIIINDDLDQTVEGFISRILALRQAQNG